MEVGAGGCGSQRPARLLHALALAAARAASLARGPAIALAVLGAPGRAAAADRPDEVRLQLKWFHPFQFARYYAAEARGFYRDERLEVEIVEGSQTRPPVSRWPRAGPSPRRAPPGGARAQPS